MNGIIIMTILCLFVLSIDLYLKYRLKVQALKEKKRNRIVKIRHYRMIRKRKKEKKEKERLYKMHLSKKREYDKFKFYKLDTLNSDLIYLFESIKNKFFLDELNYFRIAQLLIYLNNDEFIIKDKNSEILNINFTEESGLIKTSKTFEIFITAEISKIVITNILNNLNKNNAIDSLNTIVATFLVIFKKSINCTTNSIDEEFINDFILKYDHDNKLKKLINDIENKKNDLDYINDAINESFLLTQTCVYNH